MDKRWVWCVAGWVCTVLLAAGCGGRAEPSAAAPQVEAAPDAAPAAVDTESLPEEAVAEPVDMAAPPEEVEPPVPPGYASPAAIQEAILRGEVKLITPPDVGDDVEEIPNVEYAEVKGRALHLDLFRPRDAEEPLPALLFIHGGGWKSGDRSVYRPYTVEFARRGYVTATMTYRLSGEAQYPAAVQDVKSAVMYLRANADRYGIDPNRIAALGGSAGGHLAMMAGYAAGAAELAPESAPEGVSDAVQAVVNLYGPTDLTTELGQAADVVRDFIGKTYAEAPDLYAQASPLTWLTADDPPTLVFHGTIDDIVPVEQADALAARLTELGVPHRYERYEGWPHTMDLAQGIYARTVYVIDRFLQEHLKGAAVRDGAV